MSNAVWSVVRGESPGTRAVEPGIADIEIPDEVLTWAEGNGISLNDPDVYLLVTPADEAGDVIGEIAYFTHPMSASDLDTIRAALDRE